MEFYYHEIDNEVLIVSADGGINKGTSREFVEKVLDLIETGTPKIIIDCSKLTFISSYGLGVLLRLHKRAKKVGGEVKIASVHSRIVGLLKITRLNSVFGVCEDVNRARLEFRPKDA